LFCPAATDVLTGVLGCEALPFRNFSDARPFNSQHKREKKGIIMASLSEAQQSPVEQLWGEIGSVHAGMLGIEGSGLPMQPMSPNADPKGNSIWFYAKSSSELASAINGGSDAEFCVVGKNHDYHASLKGTLSVQRDLLKIDEYWNSVVAAWFEHGKDDPDLTMLRLRLRDGQIWASTGNTLKFGWEIARANYSDEKTPDVGITRHVAFA
jgi:general stress protein 26